MDIECTQRLECTQDDTQIEKTDPEQIGFLGICGTKYPVRRGPNKIGRDPKTCRIVLNLNSISRQHAVINILNLREFMLMDLDSANKTKVQGKTLQPYIPHPLKNGDTVQFGDVFGVFRLLDDDNDLPMTQALDIPCTPNPVSKMTSRCGAPPLLVPESPEVSDKDDSFIMPSQPKISSDFKYPLNRFLKTSNKTIAILPMGSKKIDNAYWQSGKKSDSFNFQLDDSGSSLNDSANQSNKVTDESNENIHEVETQQPNICNESTDSIYTANTQLPLSPSIHCMDTQQPAPDIYNLNTQPPEDIHVLKTEVEPENIYNCDTQVPANECLLELCKMNKQEHVQLDLFTDNKENDNSIFNAETQVFPSAEEVAMIEPKQPKQQEKNNSDEEILFDEINTQSFHEEIESQPLLPADLSPQIDRIENIEVCSKRIRVQSGSSTDCEDFNFLPTQKITTDIDMLPEQDKTNDIDILPTQKIINDDDDLTDCEDEFVKIEVNQPKGSPEMNFENMATQVLGDDEIETELNKNKDQTDSPAKTSSFEDMPTQIITNDCKTDNLEDMPTQIITVEAPNECVNAPHQEVYSEEMISPFKVPFQTPLKSKSSTKLTTKRVATPRPVDPKNNDSDDPNYYAATQDILDDLCSQREPSLQADKRESSKLKELLDDDEVVPCSVEDYEMGDRFRHIENVLSPVKKLTTKDKKQVCKALSSNVEVSMKTPKNLKIINAELPDSQEIKISVTLNHKSITESSSDSELEDISDQQSGITFGRKNKSKINAKLDLTKRFEESLPTRIITRVRKPTYKIRTSDEIAKNQCKNILTNPFLIDSEDSIDTEIINENISRLKSKADKKREKRGNNSKHQSVESGMSDSRSTSSRSKSKKSDEAKLAIDSSSGKSDSRSRSSRSKSKKSDEAKFAIDSSSGKSDSRSRSSRSKSKKSDEAKLATDSQEEMSVKSARNSRNKKDKGEDVKSKTGRDNKRESKEKDRSDSQSRSRTRNDSKQTKITKDISKSKEKENKKVETESSPDIEIRRSKRHRTKDHSKEGAKHEKSIVYLSSESSTESPKTLKRPASNELELPSPKRTRSLPNSKSSSVCMTPSSTSVCPTPARAEVQHVLFTAFSNDDVRSKLETLGAVLVTDVMACTVLVTLQIKRTFKLLCAVGLGRPIVGPDWVQACANTNSIVDPWMYIIRDVPAEKRFRFNLEKTLRGKRNFLKGYNVSATPSVLPNAQEMKLIVECSGGTWRAESPNWICVSSSADRALWGALQRRGATVVSTEFILGGVLRQQADAAAAALGVVSKKKEATGEFVCTECGRRCLSRIGLSSHARAHTRS